MSNFRVEKAGDSWERMIRVKRKPGSAGLTIPDDTSGLFLGLSLDRDIQEIYMYEPGESYSLYDHVHGQVDLVRTSSIVAKLAAPSKENVIPFND